jgi:putative zinc finger/helix-turn-helix YgiT family protein
MKNIIANQIYCPNCHKEVSFTIKKEQVKRIVLGIEVQVQLENPYCNECGSLLDVPAIERRNSIIVCDAYRMKTGLLTSEEIIHIRTKYGLTAVAFSKLIGAGEKTITRYENGSIQDATHDRIIRLLDDTRSFEELYSKFKSVLTNDERAKTEKVLTTLDAPKIIDQSLIYCNQLSNDDFTSEFLNSKKIQLKFALPTKKKPKKDIKWSSLLNISKKEGYPA